MSLAGTAARGGAVTFGGQLISFLIQMASVAILARLITPESFGIYTMAFAVVGISRVLGDAGLSLAAIQSQNITPQQRTNLFWTNALIGAVLASTFILLAPLIANFYGLNDLVPVVQLLACTFLLHALSAQFRAEVSSKFRFTWLAAVDVLAMSISLLVAILMALDGYSYWALVAQQISIALVTLIGLAIVAKWLPGLPKRGASMRELYRFGANTLGVQTLTYVTSNIDSILIGRVWGAGPLGLYDRAYQLFRLPLLQIAAPMTKVAMPVLSKLQNDPRYDSYVHRAQLVLGYTFGGALWTLAATADPLVDILLGDGWSAAKPIFVILAIGGVFQAMGFVYYWVFLSRALTGVQLRWTIIGRSLMIALICVGVTWGPLGVAVAVAVGQAANWTLQTVFPMRVTGVRRAPLIKIACRPMAIFSVATALSLYLSVTALDQIQPWMKLTILLLVMLFIFCLASLVPVIRRDYLDLFNSVLLLRGRQR